MITRSVPSSTESPLLTLISATFPSLLALMLFSIFIASRMMIGNIPFNMEAGLKVGIYEEGSVLNILYQGVTSGWYPPLIFLGIGAMTDFSALISNPKLMLIGAAAQFGIFGAYIIALLIGFEPNQAGAIGIIGGADGPTAVFAKRRVTPLSFRRLPKNSIQQRQTRRNQEACKQQTHDGEDYFFRMRYDSRWFHADQTLVFGG